MSLPENATNPELNKLIFYAIDKASPYALAMFDETNSLEKISDMSLLKLAITEQGKSIMWLWINAHSGELGAKPVAPSTAGDAENVSDVVTAVYDTTKQGN